MLHEYRIFFFLLHLIIFSLQLQDMAFGSGKGKKKKTPKPAEPPLKKEGSPPKANGQLSSSVNVDEDWQRRDTEVCAK